MRSVWSHWWVLKCGGVRSRESVRDRNEIRLKHTLALTVMRKVCKDEKYFPYCSFHHGYCEWPHHHGSHGYWVTTTHFSHGSESQLLKCRSVTVQYWENTQYSTSVWYPQHTHTRLTHPHPQLDQETGRCVNVPHWAAECVCDEGEDFSLSLLDIITLRSLKHMKLTTLLTLASLWVSYVRYSMIK